MELDGVQQGVFKDEIDLDFLEEQFENSRKSS